MDHTDNVRSLLLALSSSTRACHTAASCLDSMVRTICERLGCPGAAAFCADHHTGDLHLCADVGECDGPDAHALAAEALALGAPTTIPHRLAVPLAPAGGAARWVLTVGLRQSDDPDAAEILLGVAEFMAHVLLRGEDAERRMAALQHENRLLRTAASHRLRSRALAGDSTAAATARNLVSQAACNDTPLLLEGEVGVGKAYVAALVHDLSPRARRPCVMVSCRGITPAALEDELFGREHGANGSMVVTSGKLDAAQSGTLYIEDIDKLAPSLQTRLLRVIREHAFERSGGVRTVTADIRFAAGTSADLANAVQQGAFRRDLYDALASLRIPLPPLRSRTDDLTAILRDMQSRMSGADGCPLRLSPGAVEYLRGCDWAGNLKELEGVLERAALAASGPGIGVEDLITVLDHTEERTPGDDRAPTSLLETEKRQVARALERHDWIQTRAARELGLTLRQMGYRVKKFGLEDLVHQKRKSKTHHHSH